MVDKLLAQPRFAPDRAGSHEPYRRLTPGWVEETVASLAALVHQELYADGTWPHQRAPDLDSKFGRLAHFAR